MAKAKVDSVVPKFYSVTLQAFDDEVGKPGAKIGQRVEAACKSYPVLRILRRALSEELKRVKAKQKKSASAKVKLKQKADDLKADLAKLSEIRKIFKTRKAELLQKSGVVVSFHEFKKGGSSTLGAF